MVSFPSAGFKLRQPSVDLLTHPATVCLIECLVHLRDLPNPFFDRRSIVLEATDRAFTPDLFHTDVLEARIAEQPLQPRWIGERP